MHFRKCFHPHIWIGLALLGLLTLPFALTDLDLTISGWFYRGGWQAGDSWMWSFLYHYGTLPGLALGVLALSVLLGSGWWPRWWKWRRAAAVIVLTLLLGPGLLVNVLGKSYWGRPRPREVAAFGGLRPFQRVIQPGTPGRGKSFPSGHPSVGYLFCVFFFLDPSRRRRWAWLGAGMGYGTLMGIGRIAQGAHFASDVLWTGGLTYLSAALAWHLLPPPNSPVWSGGRAPTDAPRPARRLLAVACLALLLALLSAFFLLATPYYKEWSGAVAGPPDLTAVRLELPSGCETIRVAPARQRPALAVQAGLQGFGFPRLRLEGRLRSQPEGTTLNAALDLRLRGLVTERGGEILYRVRDDLTLILEANDLDADLRLGDRAVPGRYGQVRVSSRRGGIQLLLAPGSSVAGRIYLTTRHGDVRLTFRNLREPGPLTWEIGTDRGTALIEAEQEVHPAQPLRLRAWSRRGDVAVVGKISPACGLSLEWNEGEGRSGLQANGRWHQDGNRVTGPGEVPNPGLRFYLTSSQGLIGMQLDQIGVLSGLPAAVSPSAEALWAGASTPSDVFAPADADTSTSQPVEPSEPESAPDAPEWAQEELITLPSGSGVAPRSTPARTHPSPPLSGREKPPSSP